MDQSRVCQFIIKEIIDLGLHTRLFLRQEIGCLEVRSTEKREIAIVDCRCFINVFYHRHSFTVLSK